MRRRRSRLLCLFAWSMAAAAHAGTLTIRATDNHGHSVANAVVTIDRAYSATAVATHYIDQKSETFIPYVEVMHPGDSVVFRNSDSTRHQD